MTRTVWDVFQAHSGRQIDKWRHYFDVYEKHFARYVGTPVRMLEIGIDHGGSLQMWKEYFGPQATIIGIDIEPRCAEYREPQIEVHIRDQCDSSIAQLGPFDIVLDDGSHQIKHQEMTYDHLWPRCRGVYLIEDIHGQMPLLRPTPPLVTEYPWVIVCERPKRIIKGTPSRPLRDDEKEARGLYGQV